MISRWVHLKPKALLLRHKGRSIRTIEKELGIPRSTLSGWLRMVPLTRKKRALLRRRHREALAKARIEAAHWHHTQKQNRMKEAAHVAAGILGSVQPSLPVLELALAFLYLGEGSKKNGQTMLGSSDVLIARFFIHCLREIYAVPVEKIRCYLHLRADQSVEEMTRFWAKELGLPSSNFGKASIDKRTTGKPTYEHYKGVCTISCGKVEIQRRLMYIANGFCEQVSQRTRA